MTIRPYCDKDFPVILDIYAACKLDELRYEESSFQLLPLDQDPRRLTGFRTSTVLIYEQDQILGYAAYDGSEITALFVHPNGRGAGIGQTLLRDMLDRIEGEVVLYVAKSNHPAKRLYERHGFAVTGEFTTDYNGTPVQANEMLRKLPK
ncbi:hypothetical protein GCM10007094_08550 [Pseudovibrio japonicus]|uniref:N-acetyltransferase domain-containing protein n=1 Tax=Pseudovibrio japonicus TaxID=366534 RepID=A0ABQ3E3Y8_9HYPH|nr:N-acetyltransferase [Pseudovibrio japonicus]GHB22650.1 hypothetical protein GCM10007094_08550 [Pseudovibrio japonicus]